MLSLKKVYRDELLQIALILSLLRGNSGPYLENDLFGNPLNYDLDNGTSWRSLTSGVLRSHYIHPKNLDSVLLNYERELFADLNLLGRYHRDSYANSDVTAYLLNIERTSVTQNISADIIVPQQNPSEQSSISGTAQSQPDEDEINATGLELTQEDMDLIEVLWKQDIDLGFSLDVATGKVDKPDENNEVQNGTTSPTTSLSIEQDDIEKLKTLKAINNEENRKDDSENELSDPWAGINYTIDTETGEYVIKPEELSESLTGADCGPSCDLPLGDLSLPLPEFLLDEALRLVDLEDSVQDGITKDLDNLSTENNTQSQPATPKEADSSDSNKDPEEDLDFLSNMIQTSQFHHPHHRAFQSRMPFVRTVSMEQRWQDLASLLSLPSPGEAAAAAAAAGGMPHPFSHHHHPLHNYSHPHAHGMGYSPDATRGVLLHNATLTPPMGDINSTVPYSNIGGTNLGNAVATSMNLTNSSEPMGESNSAPHYKLEPSHDMMYYQNSTSELNQTDGFLSSILNDEDLQLMDMAMNEGMYTMRMLDSNNTISNLSMGASSGPAATSVMSRSDVERMDTSSDSAVSSMGSERVPSLSDGEWCDAGSDSGHTAADHYVTDYQTKYRPYDYSSYSSRQHGSSDAARMPPVAQKKHQMFGKRYLQEQGAASAVHGSQHQQPPVKYEYRDPSGTANSAVPYNNSSQSEGAIGPKPPEMKYSCSMEFGRHNHIIRNSMDHVQHNHTYHLPAENTGALQRPVSRDKSKHRKSDDEHLTRDEKRARALNVPITVDDIINLPMDEFNERLSKYDLTEAQLSLIRDIRRRGKNKVAAQNCRKRKLDQILSLADEVKDMRDRKMRLVNEHEFVSAELQQVKDKYQQLYRHVFQNLRDPDGNQYSPYQYSLQTSADGSILVVPRTNSSSLATPERKDPPSQSHKE